MRWPWQPREKRETSGDYSDAVVRLILSQASGAFADTSSTAAVEAAAGALSRAFSAAEVVGEAWVQETVSPRFLGQVGRDLIRTGASLSVIRLDGDGMVRLIPASSWSWEGAYDPASWTVRATASGPSSTTTWHLPRAATVFVTWGSLPGRTFAGVGPLGWASTTARLQGEAERSLADEAGGPLAQLLAIPQDGGDGGDDDPLAKLKLDIGRARGKALVVETTAAGWGEGAASAPRRDWQASRLGPAPPESLVAVADAAYSRVLAACGCSPALFDDSDGTSKREALRQWFMGTVKPLARLIEHELSDKLDTAVQLRFDNYPLDLAGRAQAFQKLVAGGVAVNEALVTAGLLAGDEA